MNIHHFAHNPRHPNYDASTPCEHSYDVSVRLMIRQLSDTIKHLRTPAFNLYHVESGDKTEITTESMLDLTGTEQDSQVSGTTVDLLCRIGEHRIAIYVTYEGREVPDSLRKPQDLNIGIIALRLNECPTLMTRSNQGEYEVSLREMLENTIVGKHWVYHPRLASGALNLRNYQFTPTKKYIDPTQSHKSSTTSPVKSSWDLTMCELCTPKWRIYFKNGGEIPYCPTCRKNGDN